MIVASQYIKPGLQYDTDDARKETPSRCQNADAGTVLFILSFDECQ